MAKKLNTTKPSKNGGRNETRRPGRAWTVQKRGNDVFYKRLDGHYVKMPPAGQVSTIVRGGSIFPDPKPSETEPQGK